MLQDWGLLCTGFETSIRRGGFHKQLQGEAYYSKLIAKESTASELCAARLMGNFILFSDSYVPVQSGTAFYRAIQMDNGKGTFYSLGGDVNCLFYKPAGEALSTPDPVECFQALADHATMTGRKFEPGYAAAFESFAEILSSRKEGLAGNWFTAPGGTRISCCTWSPLSASFVSFSSIMIGRSAP